MSIIENKRLEAAVVMRTLLVAVLSLLALTEMSDAAQSDLIISRRGQDLTPALRLLPADHPLGTGATVTLVSLEQVASVHELTLSAFIVDYAPGGSAVLHRAPSSGYVLVHVLSGAIRASAWEAGVGTYSAGEDWAFPAFANNIATTNLSTRDPAQALVVLVTDTPPTVPQAHGGRDDTKAAGGSEFKRHASVLAANPAHPVGKESFADTFARMQAESSKSDRFKLPTDANEPVFARAPGINVASPASKPATHASVATLRSGRAFAPGRCGTLNRPNCGADFNLHSNNSAVIPNLATPIISTWRASPVNWIHCGHRDPMSILSFAQTT